MSILIIFPASFRGNSSGGHSIFCPFLTTFFVSRLSRFILQSKLFCGNPTLARRRDCDKTVRQIFCHIFSDKVVTMQTIQNKQLVIYSAITLLYILFSFVNLDPKMVARRAGVSSMSCRHVPCQQIRNCANCPLCPWWWLMTAH